MQFTFDFRWVEGGAMQIKNRQQMLMLVALAGLALLVGDSLIFSPLVKAWKSRSEKIVELRKQVDKGERLVKHEESYRSALGADADEHAAGQSPRWRSSRCCRRSTNGRRTAASA